MALPLRTLSLLDLHQTHRITRHALLATGEMERSMTRLIGLAFALALASSAQAIPLAPLQQQNEMVIIVREACGAGMHMVNGVCVGTHARGTTGRCARGVTCSRPAWREAPSQICSGILEVWLSDCGLMSALPRTCSQRKSLDTIVPSAGDDPPARMVCSARTSC